MYFLCSFVIRIFANKNDPDMKKNISLFIAGTGVVGSELLNYLKNNSTFDLYSNSFIIRVVGIVNRSGMFIDAKGINLNKWKDLLVNNGKVTDMNEYIDRMTGSGFQKAIFADCTDGSDLKNHYREILKKIPVVTPNKSANSGYYKDYVKLREIVQKYGTGFRYSANTGVGLPGIDLIHSMREGGDRIIEIKGLFSSTMNYILENMISTGRSFSDLIIEAREEGLTEPDPRIDLNGIDSARKILILAREAGAAIELDDIRIQNLVPAKLKSLDSAEQFLKAIRSYDYHFEKLKRRSLNMNCKPVYSASFKKDKGQVKIEMVNSNHPFYSAGSSEKILLIRSEFYNKYPLIIKGSSGGAKATAALVVSDILKLAG